MMPVLSAHQALDSCQERIGTVVRSLMREVTLHKAFLFYELVVQVLVDRHAFYPHDPRYIQPVLSTNPIMQFIANLNMKVRLPLKLRNHALTPQGRCTHSSPAISRIMLYCALWTLKRTC